MEDINLTGPTTMAAPWGLEARILLVTTACKFFDVNRIVEMRTAIGQKIRPGEDTRYLSAGEFLEYLNVREVFPKPPNVFRVTQVLELLVEAGILTRITGAGGSAIQMTGIMPGRYMFTGMVDGHRAQFRVVSVLGPEFLYRLCEPVVAHVAGTDGNGDPVAGTGLVIHEKHILTCRHVVCDMKLNPTQRVQGQDYEIGSLHCHPRFDIALLRMSGPSLAPVAGLFFQQPIVGQDVYTLGYPKLPGLREASVTMQPGAVTNELVTSLAGDPLFLYSAIARPGNSGGPVMSRTGYVLGLSIGDSIGQYPGEDAFSPHYAGIPAQVLVQAVQDLDVGIGLPFESHE